MKIKHIFPKLLITASLVFVIAVIVILIENERKKHDPKFYSQQILEETWKGFRHFFIGKEGRVIRPHSKGTFSSDQTAAMLRAFWMEDKHTFDTLYRWSERNLSREVKTNDSLLARQWKDGEVVDWRPRARADINYALSLILAQKRWFLTAPPDLEHYGRKASYLLLEILRLYTFTTKSGRLYLAPWIINGPDEEGRFPLNPSYYSPAYFQIFYEYTNDQRWLQLIDTTYFMFNALTSGFNGKEGKGLIPDWCSVDNQDRFFPLPGKSTHFSEEAVHLPFHLAMDIAWFNRKETRYFLQSQLGPFWATEWRKNNTLFSDYTYTGLATTDVETPVPYAAAYCVFAPLNAPDTDAMLGKTRAFIKRSAQGWVYAENNDYYANSLTWFAEGLHSGIIDNISKQKNSDEQSRESTGRN